MKKILIANRGEIAVRILRAAKEMNIKTVAVYSKPDRNALHVRMADEAYEIGEGPAKDSYLKIDTIMEVAKKCKADAIHPGYGFLSENAHFAARVEKEGLIFIGPSSSAIDLMGDKLRAKALAKRLGVPLVPGSEGSINSIFEAKKIMESIGFPILIKASAGGGGKGMRIVEKEEDFESSLATAVREATSAFGDGSVFIERYISSPKHIEIQVLGDSFGNMVYLFERECSVQRRHQKVIEEAPSSLLSPSKREEMGKFSVLLTRECGYKSAGTIEYIMDAEQNFYFLEMNTRLQVEHPVTEMITGVDLVKEQIRIARGESLSFKQEDISIRGHAIELRVYAEDPYNGFLPDTGILERYTMPSGPGVRVDNGVEEKREVSIYYDPMLAKLITYGKDRMEAIERMIRAIQEYDIKGVANTLGFGDFVMHHSSFRKGEFDTHFVKNYFEPYLKDETYLKHVSKGAASINKEQVEQFEEEIPMAIYFVIRDHLVKSQSRSISNSSKKRISDSKKFNPWRKRGF